MSLFRAMGVSASGLTAERLRMDVIANNIANINTTRGADGEPYRRRTVVQSERPADFSTVLAREIGNGVQPGAGVRVTAIVEDPSPFKLKYDPGHPDADERGYVRLPNVDLLQEITDMMLSTRVYEANVTAFNASKAMALRALEIGK